MRHTVAGAILGATVFAGCSMSAGLESSRDDDKQNAVYDIAAGSAEGSSEGVSGASEPAATDTGVKTPVYSYSYLCGGSTAECMPGTTQCAPGGSSNMSADAGAGGLGCQLTTAEGKVNAECTQVGSLGAGSACTSAAHCGDGLGCVTTTSGSICRQYCCDNVEACPDDTYCAPTMMAEAALPIPICKPVQMCTLLDDSGCSNGQVCTIVRDKGTTSCVDPGVSKRGEPCPCASGYVCAKITNTCLKLCRIGNDAIDCEGGGVCQGGVMGYPNGFGTCVGYK